ncbi:MAG: zf-HC2 domain-containing protein, partial [Euzebyales bacterium]|nr:zf-HC2 domain-containing protein [Euzebyales bacterium]
MVDCGRYEPLHSAWVDGELNRGERADMAAHLQVCGRCRSRINGLRVTAAMVASLPPRQMPDGLLGDIGTPAAVAGTVRHHPSAAAVRRG